MIVPDVNLLVHAYNVTSAVHGPARRWWEDLMNGSDAVGLAWVVAVGFLRLTTHRQVLERPLGVDVACRHVRVWLDQPPVSVLHPGPRHADLLFQLLEGLGTAGNLTTDAHLAALAIEHQAELHSTDVDFHRFSGLRWTNPLT
jgi:toxin-antitoxin system PIN domain toxin